MKTKPTDPAEAKKIGIFGGTFDPVHIGHLIVAESVREQAGLDIVIFIPSAHPPHKHYELMFSPRQRYDMIASAIEGNPTFAVSDIELKREGPSYTVDTLREIKKTLHPDAELYFIVGRDNLYDIEMWKNPREIIAECAILVADRVCDSRKDTPEWLKHKTDFVSAPLIEISSSDIRHRIRDKKNIDYMVPDSVIAELHKIQ